MKEGKKDSWDGGFKWRKIKAYRSQDVLEDRYIYTFWVGLWASRLSMRRCDCFSPNMETPRDPNF